MEMVNVDRLLPQARGEEVTDPLRGSLLFGANRYQVLPVVFPLR
jgi:hypothetical protein